MNEQYMINVLYVKKENRTTALLYVLEKKALSIEVSCTPLYKNQE